MTNAINQCSGFYDPAFNRVPAEEDFTVQQAEDHSEDVPDEIIDDDFEDHMADTEDDAGAVGATMDERLDAFLASTPGLNEMYTAENIMLAAYARITRPADYELLRSFAQKNKMSLRLYEKSVKAKEAAVRKKQQERMEKERITAAERHSGKEMPEFIYYNQQRDCLMVNPALLAIHVKENLCFILVQDSLRG